jgi:hypothetical protein
MAQERSKPVSLKDKIVTKIEGSRIKYIIRDKDTRIKFLKPLWMQDKAKLRCEFGKVLISVAILYDTVFATPGAKVSVIAFLFFCGLSMVLKASCRAVYPLRHQHS